MGTWKNQKYNPVETMNAADVIQEIDALPLEEQSKVMVHLHHLQEKNYHQKQV